MKGIIFFLVLCTSQTLYTQDIDPVADLQYAGEIYDLNMVFSTLEVAENTQGDLLNDILEELWYVDDIRSIFLKAFLLRSDNPTIHSTVKAFLDNNNIEDKCGTVITNRYKMTKVPVPADPDREFRYTLDNKTFDEGINYAFLSQSKFFDDKLLLIYPWNPYSEMVLDDPAKGKEAATESMQLLMYGGGTNMLTLFIGQHEDPDQALFVQFVNSSVLNSRYKSVTTIDVTEHLYNKELVRKAFFLFGSGPDKQFSEAIQNADAYLVINSLEGKTYRIDYFMNISTSNNNYAIREDLWRLLRLYCLMSVLNQESL